MEKPSPKQLSPQEWESLIDDHQHGGSRRTRWISENYSGLSLLDLSLSSITRKDFPANLKLHLIVFLEEFLHSFLCELDTEQALTKLLETLRAVIQSPIDGVSVTYSLKEQLLVSTTSTFISCAMVNTELSDTSQLEALIDLLLTVVNRPSLSHGGMDRQTRGVACECLRELERECPGLLSETAGHVWVMCQNERTHVAQSYVLLLANLIHGVVISKANVPTLLSTSTPLVPFRVSRKEGKEMTNSTSSTVKELRRVMAFLLEWPQNLTPFGLLEFISIIIPIALELELQVSLLKVQFSGLLYTHDMLLSHAFLGMYLQFLDAFDGQQHSDIASRLVLIATKTPHSLVFRLLVFHWLLGFVGLLSNRQVGNELFLEMSSNFYPNLYDPLALKSLKLDLLGYCSMLMLGKSKSNNGFNGSLSLEAGTPSGVKLFEDGLVSVSGFKWLPPWSTETAVTFRAFHKYLIGQSFHGDTNTDSSSTRLIMESTIFQTSKRLLVDMTLESRGLVPVMVAFFARLLGCSMHRCLGECLLQTFDKYLLPKVYIDYRLGSYFPIFEKIAQSNTVPPGQLLELLGKYMIFLVQKHGSETGLRSWSQGSKVLGLCRTLLLHHPSSILFCRLSNLLAFCSLYFPDLEVRDNARIYLRMLMCLPGQKLRSLLTIGDQLPSVSPPSHSRLFFNVQSPRISHDLKKSRSILSLIHLERVVPLLVKQSWSLSLSTLGHGINNLVYQETIRDNDRPSWQRESDSSTNTQMVSEIERIDQPLEPLRVTDSKVSKIVGILKQHFSTIPDFRHISGLKIRISCRLGFKSEPPYNRVWGVDQFIDRSDGADLLPTLYAAVLTFSSSGPYGSIPSCYIPFLSGGSPTNGSIPFSQTDILDVAVENDPQREEEESPKFDVMIEMEPREPVPGLVDVSIEANAENGQIIRGKLESVTVGIEDMFLKATVPDDIEVDSIPGYYVDLFDALWEACGSSSSTGNETFPLKGGEGVATVSGTRSVKLLEIPATSLIQAIERNLAPFVVSVVGDPLVNIVRDGGVIRDIIWGNAASESRALDIVVASSMSDTHSIERPVYLKYVEEDDDRGSNLEINKKNMGCFLILIFLPPRFHLLLQMEVCVSSTLVRIRTDHWPCLAYVDDYLEALFFS